MTGRAAGRAVWAHRDRLLWLVLIASIVIGAGAFLRVRQLRTANETINRLLAREDVDVRIEKAPSQLVIARVNELLRRDRFDEAQLAASRAPASMPPRERSALLYNIANAQIRQALMVLHQGDFDRSAATVNVAKAGYRAALKLDPGNWNARNNLDVAMRIVRDLPEADNGDAKDEKPTTNWTDLPGIPKGLP